VGQHRASASRLLGLDGFESLAAQVVAGEWQLKVQTIATVVGCQGCGVQAELHGRRRVRVRDLPIGGRPVRSSADSLLVMPGRRPSSMSASLSQRCRQDSEIPKSLAICDSGASPLRHRDHVTAELDGERLRHHEHPSSEDRILTGKESTELGAVPWSSSPRPGRLSEDTGKSRPYLSARSALSSLDATSRLGGW
jgi:hypothetical protein